LIRHQPAHFQRQLLPERLGERMVSFVPIRIGVHAGYLDRSIAGVIDRSRQRLLQLCSALRTLFIGGGGRMLYDRLALADRGQASDQDQSDCIHLVDDLRGQIGLLSLYLVNLRGIVTRRLCGFGS
jgi:hypothetical protein